MTVGLPRPAICSETFPLPIPPVRRSLLDAIGSTPLVALQKVISPRHATVLVKCELLNPLSSVKDRVGRSLIESAELSGALRPGMQILEATSGNTGIALAFVAAVKEYPLTLVIPDSMSQERRALLRALGADFVLTPAEFGMLGALDRAEHLLPTLTDAWMPRQFDNPANPAIHRLTTGPEIWAETGGQVDALVVGVGTGGTVSGVGRFLKSRSPGVEIVAVEPAESPLLSGGKPGPHGIQGIGPGFVPANLDRQVVDRVEAVDTEEACVWARRLAREEGLLAGISTGANVAVAARLAQDPAYRDKTIVTFACSSGERYLSTRLYQLIGMAPLPY